MVRAGLETSSYRLNIYFITKTTLLLKVVTLLLKVVTLLLKVVTLLLKQLYY